jgi:hypothetical protein
MAGPLTRYYVIIALRTGAARVSGTLPSFIFREYRISLIDTWNSTRYYNGSAQMSGTSFRNPNGGFFCSEAKKKQITIKNGIFLTQKY